MDKPNRILPQVRPRDSLQGHYERLAVPCAQDLASHPGTLPNTADRFIACRTRQDDIDDFRSPKRIARDPSKQSGQAVAFNSLLACSLGLKTPPQDLQLPSTSKSSPPGSSEQVRKGQSRILKFANTATTPSPFGCRILPDAQGAQATRLKSQAVRHISPSPFKVLDAPALVDDFYVNVLAWSQQNLLAVGLGTDLYIYNCVTSRHSRLRSYRAEQTWPCSLSWSTNGAFLAVGLSKGTVEIWDVEEATRLREMAGHASRVSAACWSPHLLSTAGRDRLILNRDIRVPEDVVTTLCGHVSEVCSLKWSHDYHELASGGNDNMAMIWSASANKCRQTLTAHSASVKGLAWSPHQNGLLATGGGAMDKSIALWNTRTGAMLRRVNTGSQVCNLAWSSSVDELLSTQGYATNSIQIRRMPALDTVATLSSHSGRPLFLAMSPCGTTAATGGDETVRFWHVFPKHAKATLSAGLAGQARTQIR